MNPRVQWGILGTGMIAGRFATQLPQSKTGALLGVGSRTAASAEKFATQFKAPKPYGSYEALLADPDIEAVYIALPHHLHLEWIIRCAEAGKQILCEKPLTLNNADTMIAIEAARRHQVFLMEAFMYRCHPVLVDVTKRIRDGEIGRVKFIQANFGYGGQPNPEAYRWQNAVGGGSILDVGGYCLSMARLMAGAALGKDGPAEPNEFKAAGEIGAFGVDEWASAMLRFDDNIAASLFTSIRVGVENRVGIFGEKGWIILNTPWFPGRNGEPVVYQLARHGVDVRDITVGSDNVPLYALEADLLAAHRKDLQAPAPAMSWADSLGNADAMDTWRREIGLVFEPEKRPALTTVYASAAPSIITRRPLKAQPTHMQYGTIEGLDKRVSRLALGTMRYIYRDWPHSQAMGDLFFEAGGNCFDSAHLYSQGEQERLLGQWIKSRGIRDESVIICKGASTPNCNPQAMLQQFAISFDRFGFDYLDIYLLHRDNLEIPVGEFVDALNELKDKGQVRAFGGSNWTIERIDQANAYAREHGKTGFTASSPNFSLAVWNEAPWELCVTASDPESRKWYREKNMALFAWSSQAGGILTGRFKPADREKLGPNDVTVKAWFSDANFERLERVKKLAKDRGATPSQIALAYVLCQQLNIFALVGPHTVTELNDCLGATAIQLSAQELKWLNLED